ncbi:hypothetical protein DFR37_10445 [Eoetvoesiella caeni]|uniref:Uncharacterized protein n=1 Tax=Eoetvoesiella caeni TaxID=645616 RepID=A0A366HE60_9BURK|nr:hypothetical protein DFR37_10445 [Eoetvoesiella caeni]
MEIYNNEHNSFLLCIIVKVANIVVYPEVCSAAPRDVAMSLFLNQKYLAWVVICGALAAAGPRR